MIGAVVGQQLEAGGRYMEGEGKRERPASGAWQDVRKREG